jgi:hypothetical protein
VTGLRGIYPRDVRSDDGAMKLERAVLLACVAVTGCSLKDMLAKADDGGSAGAADSGTTVSAASAADAAPGAVSDAGAVAVAVAVAKNAVTDAGAVKAKGIPTCAKGQVMATVAMSPFKAFCGAPCKTNADCHGQLCEDVNSLGPDGNRAKSGPEFIKVCDPETSVAVATGPSGGRASTSASASAAPPATAAKCGPNQHFDDIDKKCRAFGDCPKGFRWNDPMKSCINDG